MSRTAFGPREWQRISPYLDQALELEAGERERWIEQLTVGEPDIAGWVRELLTQTDTLGGVGFLDQPLLERLPLDDGVLGERSMVGRRVGAYTIERLLDRGGMGEVWLASRSDGHFEGRCAIKLLDGSISHPRVAERFRREGQLLARLAHPNIARLLDAGTTEEGRQYLALEYVDGERIDHHCRTHDLSVQACVRLFLSVVSAVAHAHAKLIVHRDLKPSNVLVTRDAQVKLLDFGIAKLLSADSTHNDAARTRLEELALTPEYAAPEQLLGDLPSTATDVYQLGMLLYVLLTGRHPLPSSSSRAERVEAALHHRIPRASEFAAPGMHKALRGDLDAILAKALRKDPNERYATAAALLEDLLRYLNHEPVSARRGAALYGARKFVGRHRLAVAVVGVALVGLCSALVFAVQQASQSSAQRDRAQLQANRAQAQIHFMSLMMSAIGEPRRPISPEEMLDNGVKLLETQYADNPSFAVRELIHISGRYVYWNNHQREYDVLTKAESIAARSSNPLDLARVECNLSATELALGRVERAQQRLVQGRMALAAAREPEIADEADCLNAAASISRAQGDVRAAVRDFRTAATLFEEHGATENVRYAVLLDSLSEMYRLEDDYKGSYQLSHRARLTKEQNGFGRTLGWAQTVHDEAVALQALGEVRAALEQEALLVQLEEQLRPSDGIPADRSVAYAELLLRVDDESQALQWFDRALHASQSASPATIARAQAGRAHALLKLRQLDAAAAQLKIAAQAIGGDPRAFPQPYVQTTLAQVELMLATGDVAQARALGSALVVQCRDPKLGLMPYLGVALLGASRAALHGPSENAEALAQEALQLTRARARDAQLSADVGEASLVLAQARLARRDWTGALAMGQQASHIIARALGPEHSLCVAARAVMSEADEMQQQEVGIRSN